MGIKRISSVVYRFGSDFDRSMKPWKYPAAAAGNVNVLDYDAAEFLAFCRALYRKNRPSVAGVGEIPGIPKIIHQIWLGSVFPPAFEAYASTWTEHHRSRGWHYVLWTDHEANYERGEWLARNHRELEELLNSPCIGPLTSIVADARGFGLRNQEFHDASINFGVRSDILKLEVVCRYGGIYADTDMECLKAMDALIRAYDFLTGLQPLDTGYAQLGSALFASVRGHPVLDHCIDTIADDWHYKGAPRKCGPVHFSKSFLAAADRAGYRDIAFPAPCFYPLGCTQKRLRYRKWRQKGAYAVHHWSKAWMPRTHRPEPFRDIDNDESATAWND